MSRAMITLITIILLTIPIGVLIGGVILAIKTWPRRAAWAVPIGLAVVGVVVAGLLFQGSLEREQELAYQTAADAISEYDRQHVESARLPEVDENFEVDVYPSAQPSAQSAVRSTPILILPIAVLVSVAVLVVAVKTWPRWRAWAMPMGLAAVGLVLSLLFWTTPNQVKSPLKTSTTHRLSAIDVPEASLAPPRIESAWLSEVDETFEADVYPSARSAVESLARKVAAHVPDAASIRVNISADLRLEFNGALDAQLSKLERTFETRPKITHETPPSQQQMSATITAQSEAIGFHHAESVTYTDKPWVEQFTRFAAEHNHDTPVLLARSPEFADSEPLAEQAAMQAAATELLTLIKSRHPHRRVPEHVAHSVITAELKQSDRIIADRFTQRLSRPYGEVYRTALLLDVSPRNVTTLAESLEGYAHATVAAEQGVRQNWARTILSIVGLIAVVMGLYAFLNLVTRGYYRGRLQLTLAAALCVGAVVVLLLIA